MIAMQMACEPFLLLLLTFTSFILACSQQHLLPLVFQRLHVVPLPERDAIATTPPSQLDYTQSLPWSRSADDDETGSKLTLKLMHRDSPFSPLAHHQHSSPEQLLIQRLDRDASRVEALSLKARLASQGLSNGDLGVHTSFNKKETVSKPGFTGPLTSGFKQGSGEYFIRLGVGTPPRQTYMVIDTGSDVMWIQCTPCLDCYNQSDPVFDPAASSSFRRLSCKSPVCGMLELHGCGAGNLHCLYQVAYGDGSFTVGEFSAEELSFGGRTTVRVAMGCGHDNEGLFRGAAGLFGLGGGALSFPSQVGRRYSKVFSYCLMDRDMEGYSTIEFGGREQGPRGTMYTSLLRNSHLETFYYVSMNGISVGGQLLTIPARAFKLDGIGGGGVILDSGTSVTRLVEVAYGPLRSAFRSATRGLPFSGGYSLFDTCYDLSGRSTVKLPTLSLHLEGNVELALPASNYFIPVDTKGTYCLAFASTSGDLSIIGNIQQQGFRVIFDSASARLGFVPNQC